MRWAGAWLEHVAVDSRVLGDTDGAELQRVEAEKVTDEEKLVVAELKELEAVAYGYHFNGKVLGMDVTEFENLMVAAVNLIERLAAERDAANPSKSTSLKPPDNYIGEQPVSYGAPFDEPMEAVK